VAAKHGDAYARQSQQIACVIKSIWNKHRIGSSRLLKNPLSRRERIGFFSGLSPRPEDPMRGADHHNEWLFSYVRPDSQVPAEGPL
jgi:hypothetical protein